MAWRGSARRVVGMMVALLAGCPGGQEPVDPGEDPSSSGSGATTVGSTGPTTTAGPTTDEPTSTGATTMEVDPSTSGSSTDDEVMTDGTDGESSASTDMPGACGDGMVGADEACDDGDDDNTDDCLDTCVAASCGDGHVQVGVEACDDGDAVDGDGCEADCSETPALIKLAPGGDHTCALVAGKVYCWGRNGWGQLGQGYKSIAVGDDELPNTLAAVDVGAPVKAIAAGHDHVCALTEAGNVRCWGGGSAAPLGYGDDEIVGDDETPSAAGDVDVGGEVVQIVAGGYHTCALLVGGNVRCWGVNPYGVLGYGNKDWVGKNDPPSAAGDVSVGGPVIRLSGGDNHTCAILEGGSVRCWGRGEGGMLGYGNNFDIGDNEVPSSVDPVMLGDAAVAIASGSGHNCVLTATNKVRCWGFNAYGSLGYGNKERIGDDEHPAVAGEVDVGDGEIVDIVAGFVHSCVLFADGTVRCWGAGAHGETGHGNTSDVGDDELPGSVAPLDLGGPVTHLAAHGYHTCARTEANAAVCWGESDYGQLGYGNKLTIGDDEAPASGGPVMFLP